MNAFEIKIDALIFEMDNLNSHFRVHLKMLMKIRSKYCLVKKKFEWVHFQMGKTDVTKLTISKYTYLKYAEIDESNGA